MLIIISGVFVISVCKASTPEDLELFDAADENQWDKIGCIGASKILLY